MLLGWPESGYPEPQGKYYCSVGAGNMAALGRIISEEHMIACVEAGLDIAGTNVEVLPGQYEYQIGICKGIDIADQMWLSRFILSRVCEKYEVEVSLHPKPVQGDWNGSGAHTNYSTNDTRDKTKGLKVMEDYCALLAKHHEAHIKVYGEDNELRLTGKHETASMTKFSYAIGGRGHSVRIPQQSQDNGCGYFEDRRPASNVDPYLNCTIIVDTTLLNSKYQ
jgi:glutamine synthetase